jgi:hypothetical protein
MAMLALALSVKLRALDRKRKDEDSG